MAVVNVFRIDSSKVDEFNEHLQTLDNHPTQATFNNIQCSLYIRNERNPRAIKWQWALNDFNRNAINTLTLPIGIIVISIDNNNTYAISFGSAFYHIDKFCDKNFAFNVAKRLHYKKINTTAQASPNTNRSKTIISYVNSNYFEYDSGESFLKIKGKVQLDDNFTLFKENIEIGTSIKFDMTNPTITRCIDLLNYLQTTILPLDPITPIPVFIACDTTESEQCWTNFLQQMHNNDYEIRFADFDIIGTDETFYSANTQYRFSYGRHHKNIENISQQELQTFCEENNLNYNEVLFDIVITAFDNESTGQNYSIVKLIDYTDNDNKCVLVCGKWYKYNDDYLNALHAQIAEINVIENDTFNWNEQAYSDYITSKMQTENLTQEQAKKTYYNERVYNILQAQNNQYENHDREITNNIEICDLYKDNTIYSVKIGNTSPKLCYAIDQSLSAIREIRQGHFDNHTIETIGLWFVLERNTHLPQVNGRPDLTSSRMLVLKNKLANWLKEVRRFGYKAVINIGYKGEQNNG